MKCYELTTPIAHPPVLLGGEKVEELWLGRRGAGGKVFSVVFYFSILNWRLTKIILKVCFAHDEHWWAISLSVYRDKEISSFFIFSPAVFVRRGSERVAASQHTTKRSCSHISRCESNRYIVRSHRGQSASVMYHYYMLYSANSPTRIPPLRYIPHFQQNRFVFLHDHLPGVILLFTDKNKTLNVSNSECKIQPCSQ